MLDVAILSNVGLDANYTYSDSSQEAKDVSGKDLPFTGMSKDTYNFIVWYEQEEFSMRLAYNARSPRLMTAGNEKVQVVSHFIKIAMHNLILMRLTT